MGVLSTMEVTRRDAVREIQKRILLSDELTDDQLADILETLTASRHGYNFSIVKQYGDTAASYHYTESALG
jgi:hypothetical protein